MHVTYLSILFMPMSEKRKLCISFYLMSSLKTKFVWCSVIWIGYGYCKQNKTLFKTAIQLSKASKWSECLHIFYILHQVYQRKIPYFQRLFDICNTITQNIIIFKIINHSGDWKFLDCSLNTIHSYIFSPFPLPRFITVQSTCLQESPRYKPGCLP